MPYLVVQGNPVITSYRIRGTGFNEAKFPVPFSFMCCSMEKTTVYNELGYSEISVITRLFYHPINKEKHKKFARL